MFYYHILLPYSVRETEILKNHYHATTMLFFSVFPKVKCENIVVIDDHEWYIHGKFINGENHSYMM